jgi:hypothetical protein
VTIAINRTNFESTRLAQAQLPFRLAEDLDLGYLRTRVADEGGDFDLLEGKAAGDV